MKVFVVAILLAFCAVIINASSLKEILRELIEESEEDHDKKSIYQIRTKDGAIKGYLQTLNSNSCGNGCRFTVTVTDWSANSIAERKEIVFPGEFEFTGLNSDRVYQIKACPTRYPKECGTVVYCQLNTGYYYTDNHQCSVDPPKGSNSAFYKIRALLDELEKENN